MKKKKEIKFEISNLFWTPETEEEYKGFLNRYNGSEKALATIAGQVAMNYILNKINKEFTVIKNES
jgi:hypothetical protein